MQLPTTNSNTNEKITSDDIDGFEIVTQMVTEKSATPPTETGTLASEPRRSNKDGAPDTISTFPFIHTIYFVIIADFLPPIVEAAMNLRIGSTELDNNDDPARPHHYGYDRHHTHFYGPRGFMGPSPGFMPPHPAIFLRGPPGLAFEEFFPPRFAFGCGFGKHHEHGKHGGKFAKRINGAGHKHRHHRAYSPPSFEEFKGESGLDSHTKYMKDFFGPRGRHDHRHHRHASDDEVAAHQLTKKQVTTSESNSTFPSASDSETDSAATVSDGEGRHPKFYATHSFGMRRGLAFGGRGRGKAHHRGMKGMGHGKGRYMGPVGMDMRGISGMGFDREHPPPPPPFFRSSEWAVVIVLEASVVGAVEVASTAALSSLWAACVPMLFSVEVKAPSTCPCTVDTIAVPLPRPSLCPMSKLHTLHSFPTPAALVDTTAVTADEGLVVISRSLIMR